MEKTTVYIVTVIEDGALVLLRTYRDRERALNRYWRITEEDRLERLPGDEPGDVGLIERARGDGVVAALYEREV